MTLLNSVTGRSAVVFIIIINNVTILYGSSNMVQRRNQSADHNHIIMCVSFPDGRETDTNFNKNHQ